MNLWFIMGTAAELIKMFPVIQKAEQKGLSWYVWSTGQGSTNFWMQYDDFHLPRERAFCLDPKAQDLERSTQAARWLFRNLFRSKSSILDGIRLQVGVSPQDSDVALVHGDTFSTFLGARYAKRLGLKLAHVEAGLRTGDFFNPFPEEINRSLVSRWSDLHFAPEEEHKANLIREKHGGKIFVTGGNSVYDAMLSTLELPRPADLPQGEYVVANLHRFENLQNADRWKDLIDGVLQAQKLAPVYFVMHPPTESRLQQDLEAQTLLKNAGVHLLSRQSYTRFLHLLAGAQFILTDGGSNQTECAYLGLPCLVMREKTELTDGIGKNCILARFDKDKVSEFLASPEKYRFPRLQFEQSPSEKIVQILAEKVS